MRNSMNVLITGGNRGLGFELIKVFLFNGNDVLSIVRSEQARYVIENDFPQCSVVVTDITNYSKLKELDYLKKNKIDILINNAGGGGHGTSVTNTESDEIEKQFTVHCLAAFNVIKAAYPSLVKSDNPIIVNISSRVGSISKNALGEFAKKGFSYSYRIAKGAQNMLTQCLSQELGPKGFKVCALHPGRLLTSSGASDAHMDPYESAQIIYKMLVENEIQNGGYYCVETGTIPW
jgi:NAD(P)-dependent dehydrogenase (short-subunit alcohol dehydrogenase family)